MHPSALLAHNGPYVQQLELGGQYRDPRSWSVLTKEPLLITGRIPPDREWGDSGFIRR